MTQRTTWTCLSALGLLTIPSLLFVPAPAGAQETAPPPAVEEEEEEAPKMNLSVAPPAPALQRSAFVHEGFYLRVNVGPGWLWSNVNDKSAADLDVSGSGFSLAADVMVGGSPSPGLALGIGALTNTGFALGMNDRDGVSRGQATQFHFLVGPFFDAFPNDKQGFHLGAEIGFAGAALDTTIASTAFGGGAAGWVGYDMWIAPEWSAGFQLRANGAYLVGDQADAAAFGLNLSVTILNH